VAFWKKVYACVMTPANSALFDHNQIYDCYCLLWRGEPNLPRVANSAAGAPRQVNLEDRDAL
jgi:hypothetical protein